MSELGLERRYVDGAWRWLTREEGEVEGGDVGSAVVRQERVDLAAADVLVLNDVPFLLVEQEAGTFVRILEIYGQTQGATPYTLAEDGVQIIDGGSVSPVKLNGLSAALQFGGGFLSIDRAERDLSTGLTGGTVEYAQESSPRLFALESNPTGGDLTLAVTVLYTVVALA